MAPKTQFTKNDIIESAFQIAVESGLSNITVRKLAHKLGCSVAPIYVNFKNTEALLGAVGEKISQVMWSYMTKSYTTLAFFNIGIGEITFAKDYPQLFLEIAMTSNDLLSMCSEDAKEFVDLMDADALLNHLTREEKKKILTQMSLLTFGIAFSIAKGIIQGEEAINEHLKLMEDTGHALIFSGHNPENPTPIIHHFH